MPIALPEIRELLLPGLFLVRPAPEILKWEQLFAAEFGPPPTLPAVPIGPRTALALGAAAAIVSNPDVTRRWFFWRGK